MAAMATETAKSRGVFLGEVLTNAALCAGHYRLVLRVPGFPPSRAVQFVQLLCRPPREQVAWREAEWPQGRPPKFTQPELTDHEPLLRRPLSIAGRRDRAAGAEIDLIYRASGTGTRWLAGVRAGQPLSVLGPLGNGFALPDGKPLAALIGGGVGIPPMIYLAEAAAAAGKQAVAFVGARSADHLLLAHESLAKAAPSGVPALCAAEFVAVDVPAVVATDDGSLGFEGFISAAFAAWLDRERPAAEELVAYCCGPEPLMQAVADLCIERGIECRLALERHMACGMGTCQSCNVKIRDAAAVEGWTYKLCCTDGPVFDARDVLW